MLNAECLFHSSVISPFFPTRWQSGKQLNNAVFWPYCAMLGLCCSHVGLYGAYGDVGPKLALCQAMFSLNLAVSPILGSLKTGKPHDSRAMKVSPSIISRAIAIASGSCVHTKKASAPSVLADLYGSAALSATTTTVLYLPRGITEGGNT